MTLSIPTNLLRAVMLASANKDIRYYLNGVFIECGDDAVILVATDGHRLHAGHVSVADPVRAGQSWIVPIDALKKALTGYRAATIDLDNARVGNVTYTPVDGRFPDWRRVVPRLTNVGVCPPISGAYVGDVGKAAQLLGDRHNACVMLHAGDGSFYGSVLAYLPSCLDFLAVIMGQRLPGGASGEERAVWDAAASPTLPSWFK